MDQNITLKEAIEIVTKDIKSRNVLMIEIAICNWDVLLKKHIRRKNKRYKRKWKQKIKNLENLLKGKEN